MADRRVCRRGVIRRTGGTQGRSGRDPIGTAAAVGGIGTACAIGAAGTIGGAGAVGKPARLNR